MVFDTFYNVDVLPCQDDSEFCQFFLEDGVEVGCGQDCFEDSILTCADDTPLLNFSECYTSCEEEPLIISETIDQNQCSALFRDFQDYVSVLSPASEACLSNMARDCDYLFPIIDPPPTDPTEESGPFGIILLIMIIIVVLVAVISQVVRNLSEGESATNGIIPSYVKANNLVG
eukprot:snap_masked-scaffold_5-processed-gene-20.69-mRNA-1 protein AED:1.00 eAED:1.00 QI:0/0/0/0/1/1/2/0/173